MKLSRSILRKEIRKAMSESNNWGEEPGTWLPSGEKERWEIQANPEGHPGALENLAADIQSTIDNAVGQVDLDFSDEPLTKKDIMEFVIRMLVEESGL